MIIIRKAQESDLNRILEVYAIAKKFMDENGNPHQWIHGYPQKKLLEEDLAAGNLYVCSTSTHQQESICAAFCFQSGPDPTYQYIEDGKWLSDLPYHVIHRLGSDGSIHGITSVCVDWAFQQDRNIRVDTHHDNVVMQHLLEKLGFQRCGIIYVDDGSPRIAYQKIKHL